MQDAAPMPSRVAAKSLPPGSDAHYSAYVGPPELFDVMGASQFRLLTTLGLREHHKLLDFGCGALRAGRLLLPYLLPGRYHGVEPNAWLLESVIREEIGAEFIALKRPRFLHNADFAIDGFGETFDFILAQSIFSHCGRDLIRRALGNFRDGLADSGLILATFIHTETSGLAEFGGGGWVYPDCVAYAPDTILALARSLNLACQRLPWFHPGQQWYALARHWSAMPSVTKFAHLSGAVLRDARLGTSS